MDTRENERRIKEEVVKLEKQYYGESVDIDFNQIRQAIRLSTQDVLTTFDKVIKSRWTWGNKKVNYKIFRALVEGDAKLSESIVNLFELVNDYRMAILLLYKEVETIKGTTKDMEKVKSKIDALLDSPAVREIGKILQNMQKVAEQRSKGYVS